MLTDSSKNTACVELRLETLFFLSKRTSPYEIVLQVGEKLLC